MENLQEFAPPPPAKIVYSRARPVHARLMRAGSSQSSARLGLVASPLLSVCLAAALLCGLPLKAFPQNSLKFTQPDAKNHPNLFCWSDTCNVYVLRDHDSAILFDLGDGSVLKHLPEIGVANVEWVLFTHHHREQCQGVGLLRGSLTKLAGPEAERALFERPAEFRKMNVRLGDAYTIHGSSYVRPPARPIHLDQTFRSMDIFRWKGREFWCVDTRGNSPGGMSYLLKENGRWLAFSGDVMLEGAKMHTWFDTEWDYGFAAGIYALHNSAALLADFDPAWLLPSHGQPIPQPKAQLRKFQTKLQDLERLYVRGYPVNTFGNGGQDNYSKPTAVPYLWQVSPHLYKFKGPNYAVNFVMVLADSGHALVVDCGLFDEKFLDQSLQLAKERLGLKAIDAVIITHMHGDHMLEAPHLKETWGAGIWALDRVSAVCEHPEYFDYAAPLQAYGKKGVEGIRFDRLFKSGETFAWEGYKFTVDWMPGQTEFALCLNGRIDGAKVAFTGDNIFGNPDDPKQTGHEAMVAHNSAILEEGYIYAAEYLMKLKPDILAGGHCFLMPHPAKFIQRYRQWSYDMRDAFKGFSSEDDYRYWFDPFWVRAEPYRISLKQGESQEIQLHLRNFLSREQKEVLEFHAPEGIVVEPKNFSETLPSECRKAFPIRVTARDSATAGVHIIPINVTRNGQRYGERFDFTVNVQ